MSFQGNESEDEITMEDLYGTYPAAPAAPAAPEAPVESEDEITMEDLYGTSPTAPLAPVEDPEGLFAPLEEISSEEEDEPLSKRKNPVEVSSEEDEPLSKRKKKPVEEVQPGLACGDEGLQAALGIKIENAGVQDLPRDQFVTRAYAYRERAKAIFEAECRRQMRLASPQEYKGLAAALLHGLNFDKGSHRRGVCKYNFKRVGGRKVPVEDSVRILFSVRLVDFGCPAKELLLLARHELSHAANPGERHNGVWAAYNVRVGGDGKRCDSSDVTRATLGHRVEIYCESLGASNGVRAIDSSMVANSRHVFKKRQVAPNAAYLRGRQCKTCRKSGLAGRLFWRRVSLADTAHIQ
eukprot:5484873-Prymnesium_polylepis.2